MGVYEYRLKPQGKVLESYYLDRSRVSYIMGPLGSGKTIQTCQKLFMLMTEQEPNELGIRPTRFYATRNTYSDLLTTTVKDWLELFGDLGRYTEGSKKPPTHKLKFQLEDGTVVESELIFLALDREEHVKKLRGAQATGFWHNEIKELPKAVIDMSDLRHGRYPSMATGGVSPTWHGMIGDTNAPDDDHWYYTLAEDVQPDGWRFFRQPGGVIKVGGVYRLNPKAENVNNLPEGYYVKGMEGKKQDWIAVNLANEYGNVSSGRPVWPEFNNAIHKSEAPLGIYKGRKIWLGWDFGLTPACVALQVSPRGQVRVLRCWSVYDGAMGIKQFASNVVKPDLDNEFSNMDIISYGDPGGAQRAQTDEKKCIEVLNDLGIPTEEAKTNLFMPRRDAVGNQLSMLVDGEPAFIIDPCCKMLLKGMNGSYQFKRIQVAGDNRFKDVPDKNIYSHVCEALQYPLLHINGGIANKPPVIRREAPRSHGRSKYRF